MMNTKEIIKLKVNVKVNYKITERRKGDVASCYASCDYAKKILNWSAEKDLTDMCRDSYLFEVNNQD